MKKDESGGVSAGTEKEELGKEPPALVLPAHEGGKDGVMSEASVLTIDAYKIDLYGEEIKLRRWKRILGTIAVVVAGLVPLAMLCFAYLSLLGYPGAKIEVLEDITLLKSLLFSAAAVGFIAIYGVIIRSTLVSRKNGEDSDSPAKVVVEAARQVDREG